MIEIKTGYTKKETYKVSVYYEEDSVNPLLDWGLFWKFVFNSSCDRRLHSECNWKDALDCKDGNLTDALIALMRKHCDVSDVEAYLLKINDKNEHSFWDYEPNDYEDAIEYCSEMLSDGELIQILETYGKDICVKYFSSHGYSQGEFVEGVAFCTKEHYQKMTSKVVDDWKTVVSELYEGDLDTLTKWLWGDVYCCKVSKKRPYIKTYSNGEQVEGFDWEEVCCDGSQIDEAQNVLDDYLAIYQEEEDNETTKD